MARHPVPHALYPLQREKQSTPPGSWLVPVAVGQYLVFELTALDIWLEDSHYRLGSFVGAGSWWLETFSHRWVKWAVIATVCAVWTRILGSRWRPSWRENRIRWQAVGISLLLAPAAVATMKHFSDRPCPWDLQRYGGELIDVSMLSFSTSGATGQCFPAGHASTGFSLFAFTLLWLGQDKKKAKIAWWTAFSIGLALGWGQQLRGAHFLSHTLWSSWICWATCLVVYRLTIHRNPT